MKVYAAIAATLGCILAGAALAVSLTHAGPRGLQGPAGARGAAATAVREPNLSQLGFCELTSSGSTSYVVYDGPVSITNGVSGCAAGTFIPVVPQSTK